MHQLLQLPRLLAAIALLAIVTLTQLASTAHAGFSGVTFRVSLSATTAPTPLVQPTVTGAFTYAITCTAPSGPALTWPSPTTTIAVNAATPLTGTGTATASQAITSPNVCTVAQLTRPAAPAGYLWNGSPPDVVVTNVLMTDPPLVRDAAFANVLSLPTVTGVANPPVGGGVACVGPSTPNATAVCTQTTNPGYSFAGFSTSGCGPTSTNSPSYTTAAISANCTVTGAFTQNTYAITTTANPAAGGSVVCNPNPVPFGSTATCSGNPNQGYVFANLSGCSGATVAPGGFVTAPMNAACTVTANFTQQQVILTNVVVPTLNGWMLMLLSLLMLGSGGVLWWRSR